MLLQPNQPPPPAYYADNLSQVMAQVGRLYQDILPRELASYLAAQAALGTAGARLHARLISRKGNLFRLDLLQYDEIPNLTGAIDDLVAQGLVRTSQPAASNPQHPAAGKPPPAADRLLALLRLPELKQAFAQFCGRPEWKKRRKAELLLAIQEQYSDEQIRRRLDEHWPWLELQSSRALRQVLVLYFGNHQQDLSTFVMQDLGLLRYADYPLDQVHRPFSTHEALTQHLHLGRVAGWSHRLNELPPAVACPLAQWLSEQCAEPCAERLSERLRQRILNRVGHWFEQQEQVELALVTYQRAQAHPARERQVRLLCKLAQTAAATELLQAMARAPQNAAEAEFCQSFDVQQGRRKRVSATMLKPNSTITSARSPVSVLSTDPSASPSANPFPQETVLVQGIPTTQVWLDRKPVENIERFVVERFSSAGVLAWHSENALSRGIAGLCYWPLVFAPQPGAFSHPFQLGPHDLFWDEFLTPRQNLWQEQNAKLSQPQGVGAVMRECAQTQSGISNALVNWSLFTHEFIEQLLVSVAQPELHRLGRFVIENLGGFRSGFPDLLVTYGPGAYEVIEVKGPNDALQPAQRSWFAELAAMGIPARVLKLDLVCDKTPSADGFIIKV